MHFSNLHLHQSQKLVLVGGQLELWPTELDVKPVLVFGTSDSCFFWRSGVFSICYCEGLFTNHEFKPNMYSTLIPMVFSRSWFCYSLFYLIIRWIVHCICTIDDYRVYTWLNIFRLITVICAIIRIIIVVILKNTSIITLMSNESVL